MTKAEQNEIAGRYSYSLRYVRGGYNALRTEVDQRRADMNLMAEARMMGEALAMLTGALPSEL